MATSYGAELLRRQFMGKDSTHFFVILCLIIVLELARNPPDGVSVGLGEDENIFCWDLFIVGPPDTLYEGGFFNAKLEFPSDFPNSPPVMTFKTPIWHPNGDYEFNDALNVYDDSFS
jgi:ubiquitin-protein ligase